MPKPHILVVDDEPHYRYLLRVNLEARQYRVSAACTGREALDRLAAGHPDLILLDLRLPDADGFELCRTIRTFSTVPILMLTALGDPVDRVRGLGCGADDYIPKPFDVDELVARVEAALRRIAYERGPSPGGGGMGGGQGAAQGAGPPDRPIRIGALTIDPGQRRAQVDGEPLDLTPTEYRLLLELARAGGALLTHEQLLERVWGEADPALQYLVHQAVSRLRRKLAALPQAPVTIRTHYGTGYTCHPAATT